VQKVQEAVLYLAEAGEAGLAEFRGKGSDYVWKDTIRVRLRLRQEHFARSPNHAGARGTADCGRPDLRRRDRSVARQRAVRGGPEARAGGVVRVPIPKPDAREPSRKISYVLAVPGTPYVSRRRRL